MNKIPLLILLFLFGFQGVFGQEFAVENLKQNYAYPWIGNYLTVIVENESCENVIVKTDNGTVEKSDSLTCNFVFIPDNIGHAALSIYVVENADTTKIGKRIYRVKSWPEFKPHFGRISSEGEMSRTEFVLHQGVRVPMHFDINAHILVVSYRITVMRKCESIYNLENKGARLEEDNRKILKNVKVGDTVFISHVKIKIPGGYHDALVDDIRIEIIK